MMDILKHSHTYQRYPARPLNIQEIINMISNGLAEARSSGCTFPDSIIITYKPINNHELTVTADWEQKITVASS